jgi:hypothetical protein
VKFKSTHESKNFPYQHQATLVDVVRMLLLTISAASVAAGHFSRGKKCAYASARKARADVDKDRARSAANAALRN